MQAKFGILLWLCVGIALVGCGNNNVPMGGTVTYTDDKTPVECGTIVFSNGVVQARGDIGSDGKYVLGFEKAGDGLPPGKYNVRITGAIKRELKPGSTDDNQTWIETKLIDPKYENADTAKLSVNVDGKEKVYNLEVDRAKGNDAKPQEK